MNRPRILLIGLGRWGKNHLRTLRELGCELYVSDIDSDRLTYLAYDETLPGSTDYRNFLGAVDAVDIVTGADSHMEITREAFLAGKDVFVEKPIAMTTQESQEMVLRAVAGNRILQVGHIYRYHPAVMKTKTLLDKGVLGKVKYAYAHFLDHKPPRKDVGVTHTDAIHFFDMFNYFFGELPTAVTSVVRNYTTDSSFDTVSTSILHYGDKLVHIEASCMVLDKQRDFCIVGDKCSTSRDLLLPLSWITSSPLEMELRAFLHSIKTRETPFADGQAGHNALKIVEACYESSRTRKEIEIQW